MSCSAPFVLVVLLDLVSWSKAEALAYKQATVCLQAPGAGWARGWRACPTSDTKPHVAARRHRVWTNDAENLRKWSPETSAKCRPNSLRSASDQRSRRQRNARLLGQRSNSLSTRRRRRQRAACLRHSRRQSRAAVRYVVHGGQSTLRHSAGDSPRPTQRRAVSRLQRTELVRYYVRCAATRLWIQFGISTALVRWPYLETWEIRSTRRPHFNGVSQWPAYIYSRLSTLDEL